MSRWRRPPDPPRPPVPSKRDESSPVEKAPAAICLAVRLSELSQRRRTRQPANLLLKLDGEETPRRDSFHRNLRVDN